MASAKRRLPRLSMLSPARLASLPRILKDELKPCCGMAGWADLVFEIPAAPGAQGGLRVPSEPEPPSANRNPRVASASFLSSTAPPHPRPRIFLKPFRDFHSTTVGHNCLKKSTAPTYIPSRRARGPNRTHLIRHHKEEKYSISFKISCFLYKQLF